MGIFQTYVPVFNRAPIALNVTFDGQTYTIQPGHDELPDVTVVYARNQNPVMGSQDPDNPQMDGARYLIVTKDEDGYDRPLTKEEWEDHTGKPCRMDVQKLFEERYGNDPKAKMVVQGKGKKTVANSRYEAGGSPQGNADFTRKD